MELDDRVAISTPEGITIELTLAGLGSRFIATLIDSVIKGVVLLALFFILFEIGIFQGQSFLYLALTVGILWFFVVMFLYDVLFEVLASGRTPGKKRTGLRVVAEGGHPVGLLSSCIRNTLRLVDVLPVAYGIGIVAILVSPKNQRVGDIAARTLVVRDQSIPSGGWEMPGSQSERPDTGGLGAVEASLDAWDVAAVTGEEIGTVRRFLERRPSLPPDARAALAQDLAARLHPKVAGDPEGLSPEEFLELLARAKTMRG